MDLSILNNPWIVGTGGSVVSGLIVAVVSRWIFSKKDDRELLERIRTANREILYAIRPGISEGITPTLAVLQSLIMATARRYRLNTDQVSEPKVIIQDLVKEVMDTSFLSAETKAQYSARLLAVIEPPPAGNQPDPLPNQTGHSADVVRKGEYKSKMISTMSWFLGLLTAFTTMFLSVSQTLPPTSHSATFDVISPALLAISAAVLAWASISLVRVIKSSGVTRLIAVWENPDYRKKGPLDSETVSERERLKNLENQ